MQDPVAANLFWRQQMSLQHDLPVGSYLLKPVQRLFKYQLLLQVHIAFMFQYEATALGYKEKARFPFFC
jgi:RhoGEF domain